MRTPSPSYCRLDLAPPLADRFIFGVAPIDYSPVLLLMPFGFHLAMDTLPSGESLLRPTTHYGRLWIWRPSFERQRDFNPPEQRAAQHARYVFMRHGDVQILNMKMATSVILCVLGAISWFWMGLLLRSFKVRSKPP